MNLQALYDSIFHQQPAGNGPSISPVGMGWGAALIFGHLFALLRAEQAKTMAKAFPRHRGAGIVLLSLCLVWSFFLMGFMDMGEFYTWRRGLLLAIPVSFYLVVTYVPEF